jgi:nucleotide-binding universal stress UspA family protein
MFKVLIAVDGSGPSNRAIKAVSRLARESDHLEVTLLCVSGWVALAGESGLGPDEAHFAARAYQSRVLEEAAAQARLDGLSVRKVQTSTGRVAEEIVRAAEAAGVDQIVMGAHGCKGNGHYPLGSVAQKVLQLAKAPVMLVR